MKQSEKGSVTMIVAVTIFFIVILLSSFFIYTTSRRRAQLEETERIENAYDGDMSAIYEEINDRYDVKNTTNTNEINRNNINENIVNQID